MTRRVPPGCCSGCLLEHATEPCPLHRSAHDLLAALKKCVAALEYEGDSDRAIALAERAATKARSVLARAKGGAL